MIYSRRVTNSFWKRQLLKGVSE